MPSVGDLVHFSIPVSSIESGVRFYEALFGWKFQQMTPTYWLAEGGLGSLSLEKEPVSATMPILYFHVENIDARFKTAIEHGAQVVLSKTDAGDGKSFFATFRDPTANIIGLLSKS